MTGNTFTFPRGAFVGFDHIARDLERLANAHQKDHYPPHNVVKHNDDEYLIELAVVGFKESDIDMFLLETNDCEFNQKLIVIVLDYVMWWIMIFLVCVCETF